MTGLEELGCYACQTCGHEAWAKDGTLLICADCFDREKELVTMPYNPDRARIKVSVPIDARSRK